MLDILEEIFKYLHNVEDLAHARQVCSFWYEAATPLFLKKIDDIEINFSPTDHKEAIYRQAISDKYREKQRQIPKQKLTQAEREIQAVIDGMEEKDADCLIEKYCSYIEAGGRVRYTNFKFVGINLNESKVAPRFFSLCGKDVKILTVSGNDDHYRYCDKPDKPCERCSDIKRQSTKCVLTLSILGTLMQKYCPNVCTLTLDNFLTEKHKVDDTISSPQPHSNESDSDEDIDNDILTYLIIFGNVWSHDENVFDLKKTFSHTVCLPKIQTIRLVDSLVASLKGSNFIYRLLMVCSNTMSVSNFGKMRDAIQSRSFDFVRALVTNSNMDTLTELFIRNLDATTINTLLDRHKSRMHLKIFKVNHLVTHLAERNLLKFLESQSATLQTIMWGLTQKRKSTRSNEPIRFPQVMPKLTHLRIGLGKQERSLSLGRPPKEVAPIDWAKQFPLLKTLMLPEFATNVTVDAFFEHPLSNTNSVGVLSTVAGLELPAKLPENLLTKARLLFPNVTQLAVGYQTIESLRHIWTMWPKLKSLHLSVIYYDERDRVKPKTEFINLDQLLTGFDESQMELIKSANYGVIGEPTFPSIGKLTDLRELTIFAACYRTHRRKIFDEGNIKNAQQNAVSDISVHHALMKLSSLKFLDISPFLYNISPSTDMVLCNHLNLFHEDKVATRNNYTIMCNYRGREEAHAMCRFDSMYKDK